MRCYEFFICVKSPRKFIIFVCVSRFEKLTKERISSDDLLALLEGTAALNAEYNSSIITEFPFNAVGILDKVRVESDACNVRGWHVCTGIKPLDLMRSRECEVSIQVVSCTCRNNSSLVNLVRCTCPHATASLCTAYSGSKQAIPVLLLMAGSSTC